MTTYAGIDLHSSNCYLAVAACASAHRAYSQLAEHGVPVFRPAHFGQPDQAAHTR